MPKAFSFACNLLKDFLRKIPKILQINYITIGSLYNTFRCVGAESDKAEAKKAR